MADAELNLMSALMDAVTAKGTGPQGAVKIIAIVEAVAGPIAELVATDPTGGPAAVLRAVDYVRQRVDTMVAAEARTKPTTDTPPVSDTTADPDPKDNSDPAANGAKAPVEKAAKAPAAASA